MAIQSAFLRALTREVNRVCYLDQVDAEPPPIVQPAPNLVVPTVDVLGLMTVMRGVETVIWPEPFARTETFGEHWKEAFTKPPLFDSSKPAFQWDGDPWPINTFGHGLFGSELYMRARTCHIPWYGALGFAAGASALWEYGFEGNGVRPSGLDLVWTPLSGLVFGEARYQVWKAAKDVRPIRVIVDPFGELSRTLGSPC